MWIQYINPIRYAFEAIIRTEFEGRDFTDDEANPIDYLELYIGKARCLWMLCLLIVIAYLIAMDRLRRTSLISLY